MADFGNVQNLPFAFFPLTSHTLMVLVVESSGASTSSATDYVFWKMTAVFFMSSDGLKDVTYLSRDGGIER